MSNLRIKAIPSNDYFEWKKILSSVHKFDFYHLPEYHQIYEQEDKGKAYLFVYQQGDKIIALPLVIRDLYHVPGLERFTDFRDATSVYGYAGPVASEAALADKAFIEDFQHALVETMRRWRIVSVFSRLHPILANHALLRGIGELKRLGQTVAIDLRLNLDEQWASYRSNHKRDIKKLKRLGAEVFIDDQLAFLDVFHKLYIETMERVNASANYFCSLEYFQSLFAIEKPCSFHLFLCVLSGEIVSGGVFSECNGIVQYHLGATSSKWLKYAPIKLVFDEVRVWAHGRKNQWFHLGGGVGSRADTLYHFKAGFSPVRFPFFVWRWVILEDIYQDLVRSKQNMYLKRQAINPSESDFFPAYRQVVV